MFYTVPKVHPSGKLVFERSQPQMETVKETPSVTVRVRIDEYDENMPPSFTTDELLKIFGAPAGTHLHFYHQAPDSDHLTFSFQNENFKPLPNGEELIGNYSMLTGWFINWDRVLGNGKCWHKNPQHYVGFTDEFDYCGDCNEKLPGTRR
jgi:hypothetical protein